MSRCFSSAVERRNWLHEFDKIKGKGDIFFFSKDDRVGINFRGGWYRETSIRGSIKSRWEKEYRCLYKNCGTIISFINYRFDGDTFIGEKKIRLKRKNAIFEGIIRFSAILLKKNATFRAILHDFMVIRTRLCP